MSSFDSYANMSAEARVIANLKKTDAAISSMSDDAAKTTQSVMQVAEEYEKKTALERGSVTQKKLTSHTVQTGVHVNTSGANGGDHVFMENELMIYTPSTASMSSGLQFMPHNNVAHTSNAVVDHQNASDMLQSQYSRMTLPENGRIHYTGAVLNNVIVESANREILTRYRGNENVHVSEELRYHPLGWYSAKTDDYSIWAFKKEDLYRGVQQDAELSSNIEYTPQDKQLELLEKASLQGDETKKFLDEMYNQNVDLNAFETEATNTQLQQLDSQNPVPADATAAEYTDGADVAAAQILIEEARTLNGQSRRYAPVQDSWWDIGDRALGQ